jgi:hypothetical protein
MKAILIVLALVVVIAAGAGLYLMSGSDKATTVDDKKIKVESEPKEDAGLRPEPGKYTYVGGGTETVSALGGGEHILPKKFIATIELKDGCEWTLKLYYLDEHRDTDTWCTSKEGIDQLGYTQKITFFGSTETVDFECTGGPVLPAGAKPKTQIKHTCSRDDRAVNRVITVGAPESMKVGDQKVTVTPLIVEAKLTGVTKGTSVTRWWLMENGQAARYSVSTKVKSDSILGETDYTMDNEYKLASLTPSE